MHLGDGFGVAFSFARHVNEANIVNNYYYYHFYVVHIIIIIVNYGLTKYRVPGYEVCLMTVHVNIHCYKSTMHYACYSD